MAGHALQVEGVCKRFGATWALGNVDLTVAAGEIHALLGHNGSGKSTLIKILAGVHSPDAGTIKVAGAPLPPQDPVAVHRAGLRFVHQDIAVIDSLDVVDNLALGYGYPARRSGTISWSQTRRRAAETLDQLGASLDLSLPAGGLLPSQRVSIAIGRALQTWHGQPKILVLDEPTQAMPGAEVSKLFAILSRLRDSGIAIVFVTHHLDEVPRIADRVTVLREGSRVSAVSARGLGHRELAELILGVKAASGPPADRPERAVPRPLRVIRPAGDEKPRRVLMEAAGIETPLLRGLSLTARMGEIVGVAGLSGSGREEVLPALAGGIARRGTVRIDGREVPSGKPHKAVGAGMGYVPCERMRNGLMPDMDVKANLTIAGLRSLARKALLRSRLENTETRGWLHELEVVPAAPAALITTLSGGNQQKVLVGRWLRVKPTVLLVDEPTQGVDVGARAGIHSAIRRAAAEGAIVIASSDADELASVCDRVLVLCRGAVIAELSGEALTGGNIDGLCMSDQYLVPSPAISKGPADPRK
jgi:ribose transport system ATP-binding protein